MKALKLKKINWSNSRHKIATHLTELSTLISGMGDHNAPFPGHQAKQSTQKAQREMFDNSLLKIKRQYLSIMIMKHMT